MAGPSGCGKSHLADIWRQKNDGKTILGARIAQRMSGNIVIENADQQLDEEGLFHLLNRAMNNQARVLMTARSGPAGWKVGLGDLISRLNAIELVRIDEPDDRVLAQILKKLGKDRSLRLDDKLVRYLIDRMQRSSQAALQLVEALNARSLETSRPLNRALAKRVLDEIDQVPELLDLMEDRSAK